MSAMHDDPHTSATAAPQPDSVRRLRRGPAATSAALRGPRPLPALDPNIIRVGFVIASVLAGVGVVAYLAAWLLIPRYDDPTPGLIRLEAGTGWSAAPSSRPSRSSC